MIQITNIINQARLELAEAKQLRKDTEIKAVISAEDFKTLISIECEKIMVSRGINKPFEINDQNIEVLKQLFLWLCKYKNFNGSLDKGILIAGKNGIGKSLILKGFCELIAKTTNRRIKDYHSKTLAHLIKKNGYEDYLTKPLLIDDIGKEQREVMEYGTKIQPIADLIALRYDDGALTFGTTNYKNETMQEYYGKTTTDRFSEMFNILEMDGESYR